MTRQLPLRKRVVPAFIWLASITSASFGIAAITTGPSTGFSFFTAGVTSARCRGSADVSAGSGAISTLATSIAATAGTGWVVCCFHSSGPTMAAIITAATGRLHSGRRRMGFSCTGGAVTSGSLTMTGGSGSVGFGRSTTGVSKGTSASAKVISGAISSSCSGSATVTTGGTSAMRRQSRTSSRGFSFKLTKPQNVITGLPSTRNTWFSPGNWMAFSSSEPNSCSEVFPDCRLLRLRVAAFSSVLPR